MPFGEQRRPSHPPATSMIKVDFSVWIMHQHSRTAFCGTGRERGQEVLARYFIRDRPETLTPPMTPMP